MVLGPGKPPHPLEAPPRVAGAQALQGHPTPLKGNRHLLVLSRKGAWLQADTLGRRAGQAREGYGRGRTHTPTSDPRAALAGWSSSELSQLDPHQAHAGSAYLTGECCTAPWTGWGWAYGHTLPPTHTQDLGSSAWPFQGKLQLQNDLGALRAACKSKQASPTPHVLLCSGQRHPWGSWHTLAGGQEGHGALPRSD